MHPSAGGWGQSPQMCHQGNARGGCDAPSPRGLAAGQASPPLAAAHRHTSRIPVVSRPGAISARVGRGSGTPCQNTTHPQTLPSAACGPGEPPGPAGVSAGGGVRPVSPLTVDGGTRFWRAIPASEWAPVPAMAELLDRVADDTDGATRELPVPELGYLEAAPVAETRVAGALRNVVTLHVHDHVWVRLITQRDGAVQVAVQLKAKAMWAAGAGAQGYARSAGYWLDALAWMLTGRRVALVDARRWGWKLTGLELCCDFEGLALTRDDATHFVGARQSGDDGTPAERETLWGAGHRVETLMVGRRGSSLSICLYDKLAQIQAAKGGDSSTYAAVWRERGYDYDADAGGDLMRVEYRFAGRGLQLECAETGEVLDFADPATATDPEALRRLWRIASDKRRLVVPDSATRIERCRLDPRWVSVQEADGAVELDGAWRQRREVQRDTHTVRVDRARTDGLRGLTRYLTLHGMDTTPATLAGALRDALSTAPETLDVEAYGRTYSRTQRPLLSVEIDAAHAAYLGRRPTTRPPPRAGSRGLPC